MVTDFDNAGVEVYVPDIFVGDGISDEQSSKIMPVKFSPSFSCLFDADSRAKEFEVTKVGFPPIPALVGSPHCVPVNPTVM